MPSYESLDDESRIYQQAVERQRQSNLRRLALLATLIVGGVFIVGTLVVLYMVITYNGRANLYRSDIDALANYSPPFQSVKIFDTGGNMIAEISSDQGGARTTVSLDQMSPDLIYAIVGAQDRGYFSRPGFDPVAVAGAFLQNIQGGTGNANDITRQVAQMVISNSPNHDNATSLDQVVVAAEITREYGKNFILQLWLNNESFGNQAFGVEAASEFYFQTHASDLNLTEGAMLAALLRNEVDNDPVPKENRQRAFDATDQVLRELATVGCLSFTHPEVTGGQYCVPQSTILRNAQDFSSQIVVERAELQTLDYRPRSAQGDHPHFVDYVRRQLIAEYGDQMFRDGFQVYTTLDSQIQAAAEKALKDQLAQQAFTGLQTGAVMVINPTDGSVMAMVGSPDFNNPDIDGQTNNVLTWQLPGATMLPILYTAALEGQDSNSNGALDFNEYLTPASILFDLPTDYQDSRFPVINGDNQFRGAISLRTALANNLKPPAVRVFQYLGPERYIAEAANMGLRFSNDPPIVDLGTAVGMTTDVRLYDMMQAYSVLANSGQYVPIRTIRAISTAENQTVDLTPGLTPQPKGAVTPSIAFLIQNILSDQSFFDGQFAPLFLPDYQNRVATRINYLNDNRDMWSIGFSRNAVIGVWMGRPDDRATIANSRDAALPVWQSVMTAVLQNSAPAPFNQVPASIANNVTNARICSNTGVSATTVNCAPQRNEFFAINHPPPDAAQDQGPVVNALVDSWTQQLANDFCKENIVQQQFTRLIPRDPGAIQWLNTATGRTVATRMGLPQPVQEVPTTACQSNTDIPVVVISSPVDNMTVSGSMQILRYGFCRQFRQLPTGPRAGQYTELPAYRRAGQYPTRYTKFGAGRLEYHDNSQRAVHTALDHVFSERDRCGAASGHDHCAQPAHANADAIHPADLAGYRIAHHDPIVPQRYTLRHPVLWRSDGDSHDYHRRLSSTLAVAHHSFLLAVLGHRSTPEEVLVDHKREGEAFLETNAKYDDVLVTESGLQYSVKVRGDGAVPGPNDTVKVHYHGTFINNKAFDSSYDRGSPATFPLQNVIAGWTEGLQLMPVGSIYKFYIPYQLAYGEAGYPGAIPPYSTLIFEVELLEIVP